MTGVEPPNAPVVSGLNSGLVVPSLIPAGLPEAQARAPPIFQQSPGGWLIMVTSLDYEN